MIRNILCSACGQRELELSETEKAGPGEHAWLVFGLANDRFLCGRCNARITPGTRCLAATFYHDREGYEPWESGCLRDMEEGNSGKVRKPPRAEGKVYTVLLLRDRGGCVWAKIPELDVEVSFSEEDMDTVEWTLAEELEIRGVEGPYTLHLVWVGKAEYGRLGYEEDEEFDGAEEEPRS